MTAQVLSMRAGAVLHVIWYKEREQAGLPPDMQRDMTTSIKTVLGAIEMLVEQEK